MWTKKTYNNAVSTLRRAFDFGFKDHPEARDPATMLRSARIGKKDRPHLDPVMSNYTDDARKAPDRAMSPDS